MKELIPDLPDRRNDPGYADWNTEESEYRKEADAAALKGTR